MQAYSRMLKLRLTWWWVWWSFCAFGLVVYVCQNTSALFHPELYSNLSITIALFWNFVFLAIVPSYVPKIEKLLKKDLKKNPENIYAKALLLEINLKKQKNEEMKEKETSELKERVKAMEDELNSLNK